MHLAPSYLDALGRVWGQAGDGETGGVEGDAEARGAEGTLREHPSPATQSEDGKQNRSGGDKREGDDGHGACWHLTDSSSATGSGEVKRRGPRTPRRRCPFAGARC